MPHFTDNDLLVRYHGVTRYNRYTDPESNNPVHIIIPNLEGTNTIACGSEAIGDEPFLQIAIQWFIVKDTPCSDLVEKIPKHRFCKVCREKMLNQIDWD